MIDLNVRAKIIKILEDNISKSQWDLGSGKAFLSQDQKHNQQYIKQMGFDHIKVIVASKGTVKVKNNPQIVWNCLQVISNKELGSRLCKRFSLLNNR